MTDSPLGLSDVPGPKGPPANEKIPGKGGERLSRGEEDRRAVEQHGEMEKSASSSPSSFKQLNFVSPVSANQMEELISILRLLL